jgi:RNA polymerase sigma-70 factor, ECF subfamily
LNIQKNNPIFAHHPIEPVLKDLLLINGLQKQDKAVFDFVFNFYYSSLCAFSQSILDDRDAAEDLVQDFFVSLWINCPDLDIKTSLKAYLFAAIRNKCLDALKHQKVSEKYRSYLFRHTGTETDSTEIFLAETELRQAIQASLAKLSPRCREIFEMSRLQGLSNQEIADKLNLSKRTVELQISNSLKILRAELAEFLPMGIILLLLR